MACLSFALFCFRYCCRENPDISDKCARYECDREVRDTWNDAEKHFCCKKHQMCGPRSKGKPGQGKPEGNNGGEGDKDDFKPQFRCSEDEEAMETWGPEKSKFCCAHRFIGVNCPTYDCNTSTMETWEKNEHRYRYQKLAQGSSTQGGSREGVTV